MRALKMCYSFIPIAVLSLATLGGCQSSDSNNKQTTQTSDFSKVIDSYFQSIPHFSGNVLIARHGEVLFNESYGYANREFEVLNDADTKFNIGSITKPFTAVAVLKLVEEGRLSLSDSIAKFMPQAPTHWQSLTIHQLLSHTSGLIHSWDLLEDSTLMFQKSSLHNTLTWYFDKPLRFKPGTSFSYSGVGYLVLAVVVESVTEMKYDQYLSELIFDPIHMDATGASDPEAIIPKLANGYVIDSMGIRNASHFYVPLLTGGGHLYSTAQDLLKFDRAIANYSILSKETTQQMFTPVREGYGYGWDIVKNDTLNMAFHTGFIPGYLTRYDRYPDHDLTLIILTNYQSDWSPVDSWDITNLVFEELGIDNS